MDYQGSIKMWATTLKRNIIFYSAYMYTVFELFDIIHVHFNPI